ncbi:hypothetical protein [Kribbella pratensis]|uniref:Uncharacterized protein n=1 Tax=Kribbella pratensis TaxID=2512112 RepID=A0A4R8BWS1_9ACTN|nr:hypothetical protein [Kribbella pratensis]TDW65617.1 hypothetical protein EV653_5628 [Kribbella pratensis]
MTSQINVPLTMLTHDDNDTDAAIAAEWDAQVERERRDLETALGYSISCVDDSLRALLGLIEFQDPQFTRTCAGRDTEQHLRNAASSLRDAVRCITAPAIYGD